MKDKKIWIFVGFVVALGLLARVGVSFQFGGSPLWPDSTYYIENAKRILSGEGYDPFYYRGPLYSYFISLVFDLFPNSIIALRAVQTLLWGGILFIYYFITYDFFKCRRISFIAVTLLSLHPLLIYISGLALSETLYIFCYSLMLGGLYFYKSHDDVLVLFFAGISLGLTFLTRSSAIMFLPFIVLWLILENRQKGNRWVTHTLIFLVALFMIAFPYVKKLHDAHGEWVLQGYGNSFLWKFTVYPLYGPVDNQIENRDHLTTAQLEKIQKYTPNITENQTRYEKNHLYKEAMSRYIRENPKEYLLKLGGKFLNNFRLSIRTNTKNDHTEAWLSKLVIFISLGITYLTFFVGLIVLRSKPTQFIPLLGVLVGSLFIFTVYHSRVRYTLSILPVMIFFSSYGFDFLWRRFSNQHPNGQIDQNNTG